MIHIKKFIDRVSIAENNRNTTVIISMLEAKGLRDELAKLLVDLHDAVKTENSIDTSSIQIEVKGGSFK